MRKMLVLCLIAVFMMSGCADLPPEPGSPGTPIGKAAGMYDGYAPTIDVFNEKKQLFSLDVVEEGNTIMLDTKVQHLAGYVYKYGYLHTLDGWKKYEFPQRSVRGSNWIRKSANIKIEKLKEDLNDGDNYILAFSCKKHGQDWKCGCREENDCGYWMLQKFRVEKKPDLVVTEIGFEDFILDNKLGIRPFVLIDNIGTKEAVNFVVSGFLNGERMFKKDIGGMTIDPGNDITITNPIMFLDYDTFSGKDVEIAFVADPDNVIVEDNEDNNRLGGTATITEKLPDVKPISPGNNDSTTEECYDSDGGKELYVAGTATYKESKCTDYCYANDQSVMECFCGADLSATGSGMANLGMACPNGCKEGACITSGVCLVRDSHTSHPLPSDPDVGDGYAKKHIPDVIEDLATLKERCTDDIYDLLMVEYCKSNKEPVQWEIVSYGDGSTCAKSGCERHYCNETTTTNTTSRGSGSTECFDSDGGEDYNVRGYVSLSGFEPTYDFCSTSEYCRYGSPCETGPNGYHAGDLVEYICHPYNWKSEDGTSRCSRPDGCLSWIGYTCPNGCKDGECLPEPVTESPGTPPEENGTSSNATGGGVAGPTVVVEEVTCNKISDDVCPDFCSVGTDADCCTDKGYFWLQKSATSFGCYNKDYPAGCSPGQGCNKTTEDGCCQPWCTTNYDVDCCTDRGYFWLQKTATGYGCSNKDYGAGCSPGQGCNKILDGCCQPWCSLGTDADCCATKPGYCMVDGRCNVCP